jgi:hypothetical protein
LRVRRTQHFSDLRHNRHANSHLQGIHNKGRKLIFELYIATRPEDRLFFEQRCLDYLLPELNETFDALAPMEGKTHSDEYVEIQRQRALSPDSPLKTKEAVAARSGDNHYMRRPGYDKNKHPSKNPEIVAKRTKKTSGENHYTHKDGYVSHMFGHSNPMKNADIAAKMSGENHPQAKLSLGDAIEIILSDKSYSQLMSDYGIMRTGVSRIKTQKLWKSAFKIIEDIKKSDLTIKELSDLYKVNEKVIIKAQTKDIVVYNSEVRPPYEPRINTRGSNNCKSKISEEVAQAILDFDGTGVEAARLFGVSHSLAKDIRRRKTWKHLTKTNRN